MRAPHSWAVFQTGRTEDYYASAFTLRLPTLRFLRIKPREPARLQILSAFVPSKVMWIHRYLT